ncbi:MAG: thioesterase family protein [Sphingomonadaceae bacterium]|nr:thioesterase family protein [Sphingomonadaceae bacterium]
MTAELLAKAEDFQSLIVMEQTGEMAFRNCFSDPGFHDGHLFGGELVAQALAAAMRTMEGRRIHSLHGYFMRPGDVNRPINFQVEAMRDGRSFSTRRVLAEQDGKPILDMLCSARASENGTLDHQAAMPEGIPQPEALSPLAELLAIDDFSDCREAIERLSQTTLVDVRPVEPEQLLRPGSANKLCVWLRIPSLPSEIDEVTQACMLSYLQDCWIAYAPWARQSRPFTWREPKVASIDSNVWFHRSVKGAEWLLYALDSPSGSGPVGLTIGRIYDRSGALIASAAQEVLYRLP